MTAGSARSASACARSARRASCAAAAARARAAAGAQDRDAPSPSRTTGSPARRQQQLRAEPDHERQPEPARDDGGMRGRPAGHERDPDDLRAELGDVRRSELVGDEDDVGRIGRPERRAADVRSASASRTVAPRPSERTSSARAASVSSSSAAIAAAWRVVAASSAAAAGRPVEDRALDVVDEHRVAGHERRRRG